MSSLPRGSVAVMNRRVEPPDSLDFFPTPPWATRALFEKVFKKDFFADKSAWDPCAGEEHMADVLDEYLPIVHRSDVFDYGRGYPIGSFVGEGIDVLKKPGPVDWCFFNPPFNQAIEFILRGLQVAGTGVAALLRTNFVETHDRFNNLFSVKPPSYIAQFSERVPMVKGRWDPDASTATGYAWFIWDDESWRKNTTFIWIPPVCRNELSRTDDHARFAGRGLVEPAEPMPLFEEKR